MSIREISKLLFCAGLALAVCGCGRPNIIGTEAAVYSRGELYAVSSRDLNSVYSATLAALKQLGIEVAEKDIDVFYAKVVGSIADGRKVTIRMHPGADKGTDLRIKTGSFGDEERSRVIYQKIQDNLKSVRK
jgi:hypothetical protein